MDRRSVLSTLVFGCSASISGCLFDAAHRGQPDKIGGEVENVSSEPITPTVIIKSFENEILFNKMYSIQQSETQEFEYQEPQLEKYLFIVEFEERDSKSYTWEIACNTHLQIVIREDSIFIGYSEC